MTALRQRMLGRTCNCGDFSHHTVESVIFARGDQARGVLKRSPDESAGKNPTFPPGGCGEEEKARAEHVQPGALRLGCSFYRVTLARVRVGSGFLSARVARNANPTESAENVAIFRGLGVQPK